jgi:hypothetical protein
MRKLYSYKDNKSKRSKGYTSKVTLRATTLLYVLSRTTTTIMLKHKNYFLIYFLFYAFRRVSLKS